MVKIGSLNECHQAVFSTELLVYRSAIYPQWKTFKYGLGGRLSRDMQLLFPVSLVYPTQCSTRTKCIHFSHHITVMFTLHAVNTPVITRTAAKGLSVTIAILMHTN